MERFNGFKQGTGHKIFLPEQFFSEVVPLIDDLAEMKVVLFCWRALMQREGHFRYVRYTDFTGDDALMRGLQVADSDLDSALERAVAHEILLCVQVDVPTGREALYFMHTPRGLEAIAQIEAGQWRADHENAVEILPERPTIYRLYEENIGVLAPMIVEDLKDAEAEFDYEWIVEAIKIAVENNKRNWKYVRAILARWQQEGRADETLERSALGDGKQYLSGKWSDFIES